MNETLNPCKWGKAYRAALCIALVLGAFWGGIIGYIVYALPLNANDAASFDFWVRNASRFDYEAFWWALFGALSAGSLVAIKKLTTQGREGA